MNNYDYLTEHEKSIFGYIENIPSEHEPKIEIWDDKWDDEDVEALETLNNIFNL